MLIQLKASFLSQMKFSISDMVFWKDIEYPCFMDIIIIHSDLLYYFSVRSIEFIHATLNKGFSQWQYYFRWREAVLEY